MKRHSQNYRRTFSPSVGFERDGEPVPPVDFVLGDGKPLNGADGPDRDEIYARLEKAGYVRKPGELTLPQALARVQDTIDDYSNLYANNKERKRNNRRTGDIQMADIELQDIIGFECSQRKDRLDVSNLIAELVRDRPGLLNNPANREWFGMVMADWLEAAHFGSNQRRVRGLLPQRRKDAAAVARAALQILSKGERGSPPRYPAYLLAGIVREIQQAFSQRTKQRTANGQATGEQRTAND